MPGVHIALLRGINVGKAKRVAMADLRTLVGSLGYGEVQTLLNSGNVVFTVPRGQRGDHAARIENGLAARLGVKARVMVISGDDLDLIIRENPLGKVAGDPTRLLVTVLANPADRVRLRPLEGEDWSPDALGAGSRAVYLWCASGILQSKMAESVNRLLGDATTARNWATILKLQLLVAAHR